MITGLVARIAGPKVLLGVVVAAAIAITFLWLRLDNATTTAAAQKAARDQTEAELDEALVANADQTAEIARIWSESWRRERLITDLTDEVRARALETAEMRDSLEEATANASIEYQDCQRVPAPPAVDRLLWIGPGGAGPAGGDADGDDPGDPAGEVHPGLPDSEPERADDR